MVFKITPDDIKSSKTTTQVLDKSIQRAATYRCKVRKRGKLMFVVQGCETLLEIPNEIVNIIERMLRDPEAKSFEFEL